MASLSVLDLCPVVEGATISQALSNAGDLAAHAEAQGYRRYWAAEHHGMAGIASAATSVVLAHVGRETRSIRLGAGGIMLPNHAPMVIAEQFGTLAALYPGRIDLGLGRAPGTDQTTAWALRRTLQGGEDRFPKDVVELLGFFEEPQPGQRVVATPGAGAELDVWILGSSTFGAQLAAILGLPFAFASHFAPAMLDAALHEYRSRFQPSTRLAKPYVMLGFNVFAADDAEEARYLQTSVQQAFVALRLGTPGKLKPPVRGFAESLPANARMMLDMALACSAVGNIDDVRTQMRAFIDRTGADELMISCSMFDHGARKRSFTIAAEAIA